MAVDKSTSERMCQTISVGALGFAALKALSAYLPFFSRPLRKQEVIHKPWIFEAQIPIMSENGK